jgi:negative regulator of sigma E activity
MRHGDVVVVAIVAAVVAAVAAVVVAVSAMSELADSAVALTTHKIAAPGGGGRTVSAATVAGAF